MSKKIQSISLLLAVIILSAFNEMSTKITVEQYINTYKGLAISEMERIGIPASITLAQGLLESGTGNSKLATEGNNHFGIKCHNTWTGKTMYVDDDAPNECFRVYNTAYDSYIDHSNFLYGKPRYAELFTFKSNDYKSWAHGLKKAGYATNPNYAPLLIDLIEKYQLYRFDDPNANNNIYTNLPPQPTNNPKPTTNEPKPIFNNNNTIKIDIKIEPKSQPIITQSLKKIVFLNNGIKATKVQKNEDPKAIAKKFSLPLTDFLAMNDLTTNVALKEGQIMYLENKKKKTKVLTHQVAANETMWAIAQKYGIKLDMLLKKNQLSKGQEPMEKEIIYLRKKAPYCPKILADPKKPVIPPKPAKLPIQVVDKPNKNIEIVKKPISVSIIYDTIKHPLSTLEQIKILDTKKEIPILKAEEVKPTINFEKPVSDGSGIKTILFNDVIPLLNENKQIERQEDEEYLKIEKHIVAHYVEQGETLYSISKIYNITVSKLMEMNKLLDYNIHPGDVLIVSE